jgi:hypothetical protein
MWCSGCGCIDSGMWGVLAKSVENTMRLLWNCECDGGVNEAAVDDVVMVVAVDSSGQESSCQVLQRALVKCETAQLRWPRPRPRCRGCSKVEAGGEQAHVLEPE